MSSSSEMFVVSAVRKLILRPAKDAPIVSFPDGGVISNYGVNNESPSIVVCNRTETPPSWQGVDYQSGVVIVNAVPEEIADQALTVHGRDGIDAAIAFLVGQDCTDQYTTKLGFVDTKLSPAGRMLDPYTGIVKRDDRDLTPVWREDDVFYVIHSGAARLIRSDILLRDYRNPDGSQIDLTVIPSKK